MPTPPYRKARLINADKPLTARWYIIFYAWNAKTGKLTPKKLYAINSLKTKSERVAYANKTIKAINAFLADGHHFDPKTKAVEKQLLFAEKERDYTIREAFDYIMPLVKNSKRPATYNSYNNVKSLFLEFCEDVGWAHWKIRTFTQIDMLNWLDYIQTTGIGNNTRNKYMGYISALFGMMKERNILKENVALGIKLLPVDVVGNTAFTIDQVTTLKNALIDKNPRIWLFVTFLFYGFIRPAEIARMRVKMIDLTAGTINLPGSVTKNRRPRQVKISPSWRKYIAELALAHYRPDDFVFGYNLVTGPHEIQKNYASVTHTGVAREAGLGKEYTLYSWKHTGVVQHYKAGIDIKTLQAQIGHQSLHETDIYLRSLNLYENREIEDKSPAI